MVAIAPIIVQGATITHGPNVYTIGPAFGQGGFGMVHHAQRTIPSVLDVVVKVPAGHILHDPIVAARFEREAQILANIQHRHVVRIIAFWKFPTTGELALVQELVQGASSLTDYVRQHPTEAPSVFLQALYAMRAFHVGAVHRDISPSNILVASDGVAKVIDFGLAKEDPRVGQVLTVTGHWFGTPGCMAPEQMNAKHVDHRADLFGLGKSMCAALQDRNPQHVDIALLHEPWRTICTKLCAYDPAHRYASASEVIDDALTAFTSAGITISDFEEIHVPQMKDELASNGWSHACEAYFAGVADIDQDHIILASQVARNAFGPPFTANAFFDHVEAGSAIQAFDGKAMAFEDCDPLGALYRALYAHLDQTRKLACFRRLCKTAVNWHRYSVMGDVRGAYKKELDPAMQAQLILILDAEDPSRVIHGHSVIPGRNP